MADKQKYVGSGRRNTSSEINLGRSIVFDCLAGHERLALTGAQHIMVPHGTSWADFIKFAPYPSVIRHYATTVVGLQNRRPDKITLPDGFAPKMKWNSMEFAIEDAASILFKEVFETARVALVLEPTGVFAAYSASDIVQVVKKNGKLTKVKLTDPLNEDLKYMCLELDNDGFYRARWTDDDENVSANETYPTIRGRKLTEVPVVFINNYDLSTDDNMPVLHELARLSLRLWQLDLTQGQALYYAASPQPVVYGVSTESEKPSGIGPTSIWAFSNPDAKAEILAYQGDGLAERRAERVSVELQMASLGANLIQSTSSAHTVSRTVEIKSRQQTSALVELIRNVSFGLTYSLRWMGSWEGHGPDAIKVELNQDLVDMPATADQIRALIEARREGMISFETFISRMVTMNAIPEHVTPEDERDRIENDPFSPMGEDNAREFEEMRAELGDAEALRRRIAQLEGG